MYFLLAFESSTPLQIASYYVIAVQKSSTFLIPTSMQLPWLRLNFDNVESLESILLTMTPLENPNKKQLTLCNKFHYRESKQE